MRPVLIALCVAGVLASWLDYRHQAAGRGRALARVAEHGLDDRLPDLRTEVKRRYDPVLAELRVGLALLDSELDRSWLTELPEQQARAELERGPSRLADAAAIAETAWPRRASSWEAAMLLGGATYLQLYRGRDPRLIAESELWEEPLLAAHRLAPSQHGPIRFLAAAYLGNWSSLPRDQRLATTELLERAFRDAGTFELLIRDWLRVAPSRAQALALVPDRPWAWQILQQIFATSGDWELVIRARQTWYGTLAADLDRSFDRVRIQLSGGDRVRARQRLLYLLPRIPMTLDFVPRLVLLLELLPAGPVGANAAQTFGDWLAWSFELCGIGECPIDGPIMNRLARLAADPPAYQRAAAFLLDGDLARADLLERRFGESRDEGWSMYRLFKARQLTSDGRTSLASSSLELVPSAWRTRPQYWTTLRSIAAAENDNEGSATAERSLERLRRTRWEARAWQRVENDFHLDLLPRIEGSGLSVALENRSSTGAVLEVYWNGRLVGMERVSRSRETLALEQPVSTELHRLTIRLHAGSGVRPTDVELL